MTGRKLLPVGGSMTEGSDWSDWAGELPQTRPLGCRFCTIGLLLLIAALSALAIGQAQDPAFEAQSVVQVRIGAEVLPLIEAHLMARDALLATGLRHKMAGEAAAVTLRTAIAVHNLTSVAGASLGLAPEVSGIVLSVRLPQADQAVRIANDLALQVLDLGQTGELDAHHDTLEFYRSEAARLWQEVSALRTELAAVAQTGTVGTVDDALGADRRLILLQDQYDLVRHNLAEAEVASRLADRHRADQFALLQRATSAQPVPTGNLWRVCALAASALLALAVASGRDRRWSGGGSQPDALRLNSRIQGGFRLLDDLNRPIMGLPRFVVLSMALVGLLISLSLVLR